MLVLFRDGEQQQAAMAELRKRHKKPAVGDSELNGQYRIQASLTEAKLKEIKSYALEQNITIIRNRVNEVSGCC